VSGATASVVVSVTSTTSSLRTFQLTQTITIDNTDPSVCVSTRTPGTTSWLVYIIGPDASGNYTTAGFPTGSYKGPLPYTYIWPADFFNQGSFTISVSGGLSGTVNEDSLGGVACDTYTWTSQLISVTP
jgi:hypothetical protein